MAGKTNTSDYYLIIDSNFICHRALNAIREVKLTYGDLRTEIILSFLLQIHKIALKFRCNKLIFAWDSIINYRKDIYKDYKKKDFKEELTEEEIERMKICYRQFSEIRYKVLPSLGFKNVYQQTGVEGDDIIASVIINNPGKHFTIISRDNDLYQLLSPRVDMYDPISHKMITKRSFEEKWGIPPQMWGEVKCIAGCKNDNVPNVPNVGPKTAIKYLKHRLKATTQAFKRIKESEPIIERNRRLVVLPFECTLGIKIKEDQLYLIDFIEIFEKYGFESQLRNSELKQWQDTFNLS